LASGDREAGDEAGFHAPIGVDRARHLHHQASFAEQAAIIFLEAGPLADRQGIVQPAMIDVDRHVAGILEDFGIGAGHDDVVL
jgi:hypothetical protein